MQNSVQKSITVLVTFVLLFLIEGFTYAYAMQLRTAELEVTPYLKAGTIAWDQLHGVGGHKFVMAGGLNTKINFNSLGFEINFEKWLVAEGLDDDKGIIPKDGYSIFTNAKYFFRTTDNLLFYPYAGVGYEKWDRKDALTEWTSLKLFNLEFGVGLEHEKGHIRAGITKIFSASAQNSHNPVGRYGFIAEGKIKLLKELFVGLFFKYTGVEDPDAKMTYSGVITGYKF